MDKQEAERLIEAYADAVYRLAYARTGSREDAEDVTQETFLRLVRTGPRFRDGEHCRAWLLRVAMNCAADLHRSAWRRHTRPLEEAEHLAISPEEPGNGVMEAVLALPERYRAVVHLYYYEGLSAAEIAAILGKREGTINTRLCRARAMLRAKLEEEEAAQNV